MIVLSVLGTYLMVCFSLIGMEALSKALGR